MPAMVMIQMIIMVLHGATVDDDAVVAAIPASLIQDCDT
jgi:hypothetical protein